MEVQAVRGHPWAGVGVLLSPRGVEDPQAGVPCAGRVEEVDQGVAPPGVVGGLLLVIPRVARDRSRRKKNQEKDAQPEEIKRKFHFSDLRNPHKNFTPLFGEVANFRTVTEKEEQESRDGDEDERCLPQKTYQSACPRR